MPRTRSPRPTRSPGAVSATFPQRRAGLADRRHAPRPGQRAARPPARRRAACTARPPAPGAGPRSRGPDRGRRVARRADDALTARPRGHRPDGLVRPLERRRRPGARHHAGGVPHAGGASSPPAPCRTPTDHHSGEPPMAYDMTDDLARRLRASRPPMAHADEDAFDADLLARVREQPIAARRTVPRAVAVPVAAGVTLTATAVVMLGGGPGDVGGPSSASAITQALHWLSPPDGTILHVRSVETQGPRRPRASCGSRRTILPPRACEPRGRRRSRPRAARSTTRRPTRSTTRRPSLRAHPMALSPTPSSAMQRGSRSRRGAGSPAIRPCRRATPSSTRSGSCSRRAGWSSRAVRSTRASTPGPSR